MPNTEKPSTVIQITDLEGRLDFLMNMLNDRDKDSDNAGLRIVGDPPDQYIHIPEGVTLVFNGDMFDHGPDDLQLARIFKRTQEKNPGRMEFILGNRDTNKLRFLTELNSKSIEQRILNNDTPTWGNPATPTFAENLLSAIYTGKFDSETTVNFADAEGLSTIKALMEKLAPGISAVTDDKDRIALIQKAVRAIPPNKLSPDQKKLRELLKELALKSKLQINRKEAIDVDNPGIEILNLKWMLNNTMGCPKNPPNFESTFEYRRQELGGKDVTDAEVLKSFKDAIKPDGAYGWLLKNGKMALKIGDTLYVHGGLNPKSLTINGKTYDNIDSWITAVNAAHEQSISDIYTTIAAGTYDHTLPSARHLVIRTGIENGMLNAAAIKQLIDELPSDDKRREQLTQLLIQNGTASTVTSFTRLNPETKQVEPYVPPEILAMLKKAGITKLILGHHPFGNSDIPNAFKIDGIDFVYADVTYAPNQEAALAYVKAVHKDNGTSEIIIVAKHADKKFVLTQIHPPITIFENNLGITAGVYTMAGTKDGGIILQERTHGNAFQCDIVTAYATKEEYDKVKSQLQRASLPSSINTDQAYYLAHNLEVLKLQLNNGTLVMSKEYATKLINASEKAIIAYRTHANYANTALTDGIVKEKNGLRDGIAINDPVAKNLNEQMKKVSELLLPVTEKNKLPEDTAILVVDWQKGFINVGDELPVANASASLDPVNELIKIAAPGNVVLSRDTHPTEAVWTKSEGQPMYPSQAFSREFMETKGHEHCGGHHWCSHCVQNTDGCSYGEGLIIPEGAVHVAKGTGAEHQFGAVYGQADGKASLGLVEYYRKKGVKTVVVCGLATDYCVRDSVRQLLAAGFNVVVCTPAAKGIGTDLQGAGLETTQKIHDVIMTHKGLESDWTMQQWQEKIHKDGLRNADATLGALSVIDSVDPRAILMAKSRLEHSKPVVPIERAPTPIKTGWNYRAEKVAAKEIGSFFNFLNRIPQTYNNKKELAKHAAELSKYGIDLTSINKTVDDPSIIFDGLINRLENTDNDVLKDLSSRLELIKYTLGETDKKWEKGINRNEALADIKEIFVNFATLSEFLEDSNNPDMPQIKAAFDTYLKSCEQIVTNKIKRMPEKINDKTNINILKGVSRCIAGVGLVLVGYGLIAVTVAAPPLALITATLIASSLLYGLHCFDRSVAHFKEAWSTNKKQATLASSLLSNSNSLLTAVVAKAEELNKSDAKETTRHSNSSSSFS